MEASPFTKVIQLVSKVVCPRVPLLALLSNIGAYDQVKAFSVYSIGAKPTAASAKLSCTLTAGTKLLSNIYVAFVSCNFYLFKAAKTQVWQDSEPAKPGL